MVWICQRVRKRAISVLFNITNRVDYSTRNTVGNITYKVRTNIHSAGTGLKHYRKWCIAAYGGKSVF